MTLLSSYTDKSGLFTSEPVGEDKDEDGDDEGEAPAIIEPHPTSAELLRGRTAVEDEDELLYGDIETLTNKERSVLLCYCVHARVCLYLHVHYFMVYLPSVECHVYSVC